VGRTGVQPGLRHVPEFRRGDFQGGPEGDQQRGSGAGSPASRVYDPWGGAGVSLWKEARSRELLSWPLLAVHIEDLA